MKTFPFVAGVAIGFGSLFFMRSVPSGCANAVNTMGDFGDSGYPSSPAGGSSDTGPAPDAGSGPFGGTSSGPATASGSGSGGANSSNGGSTSGGATGGGGSSSGSVTSGGSGSSSGVTSGSSGSGSGTASCPAGLQDKITSCTASVQACTKGCGPDVAGGSKLGNKSCSCNTSTSVYNCQQCVYPSSLPQCYRPSGTQAPACASGVADGASCSTPCSGVCTITSDAGKTDGCVCVMGSSSSAWSCATQWW